jgi:hypothetical protein
MFPVQSYQNWPGKRKYGNSCAITVHPGRFNGSVIVQSRDNTYCGTLTGPAFSVHFRRKSARLMLARALKGPDFFANIRATSCSIRIESMLNLSDYYVIVFLREFFKNMIKTINSYITLCQYSSRKLCLTPSFL